MFTPQFIVARNANDLARLLGRPEPYFQRNGAWLLDHEKLNQVVESALQLAREHVPVAPVGTEQLKLF